ncbi:MAG: DUF4249 family protein [Paludibacteraceae bacterium]
MKRIVQYILFLFVLACTACDSENNFFYHPVAFNGKVTEPQMVVTARLYADSVPVVHVNRSRFFQDKDRYDSIKSNYFGNEYYEYFLKNDELSNAMVQMQVNDGDWQTLHETPEHVYTSDHRLQPNDLVNIRVVHPDFSDVATVQQRIPAPAQASITFSEIDTMQTTFSFGIDLPAYTGDSTHLLRISCTSYVQNIHYEYYGDSLFYVDTIHENYPYVFSNDLRFARCDKTNETLSDGYYGANSIGLYVPVSNVPTHYDMKGALSPYYHSSHYYGKPSSSPYHYPYITTQLDSIEIRVETVTIDEYLTWATMLAGYYVYQYVPDYFRSDNSDADDLVDIIEIIQEMFDEMGNMEGVQLYDNVEGGIGHVSALNSNTYIFYPDYIQ